MGRRVNPRPTTRHGEHVVNVGVSDGALFGGTCGLPQSVSALCPPFHVYGDAVPGWPRQLTGGAPPHSRTLRMSGRLSPPPKLWTGHGFISSGHSCSLTPTTARS